jgi:hypothetical protein
MRLRIAETVEAGIASSSAISGPVMRRRRREAIAAIRSSGVRLATECGAEERSSRPSSPSRSKQRSHFETVRTLTPADAAASASFHPSSRTRLTMSRRLCGQVLALRWSFIRIPPWGWVR